MKYTGQICEEKQSFDDIKNCYLIETEIKETESNPPQHYNESSIVKKLESSGVGRPSTYASIVNTLYNRNYTNTRDIEGEKKTEPYHKLLENNTIIKDVHKKTLSKQKKRILLTDLGETVLDYLLKHFSDMICVEFTANVESDLDLISSGNTDFHTIIKKVYDVFYPVIERQMKVKRISKDSIYIGDIEVKNGKFGYYITVNDKNYGLTNYMKATKKKLNEITEKDIQLLIQYPKKVGKYKNKDVILQFGIYGIYMKYNEKNYRIDKLKDHSYHHYLRYSNNYYY